MTAIKYKIPQWCEMPIAYHQDGIGGCWGISYGYVERKGKEYCKGCEYYKEAGKMSPMPKSG